MKYFLIESFNRIFNRKRKFKLVAYVNLKDQDTLMETFEILTYSKRMAHKEVFDALIFKHGEKFGVDIRFV